MNKERRELVEKRFEKLFYKWLSDADQDLEKLYLRLIKDLSEAEVNYFNNLCDVNGMDI